MDRFIVFIVNTMVTDDIAMESIGALVDLVYS